MRLRITVLAGDGIGPEVTTEAQRVLKTVADAYDHDFEFDERLIGAASIKEFGAPLSDSTLNACLKSDAVLLGAVGSLEFAELAPEHRPEAGLLNLRQALGAYANLRPAVSYASIVDCSPLRADIVDGADILIVRELLGGLYFGEPRGFTNGKEGAGAFNTMRYSVEEIERIARIAFEAARARSRKVTSVDKANVLETSQLWRKVVSSVAQSYTDITLEHLYVDACAMHLMMNPKCFDVLLTENLFGDILSDEAAAISGSLGLLASASIGGAVGLYEPVHGSAPDIANRGHANPLGAIASAALLLRYTARLEKEAQDVEEAIRMTLDAGYRTPDINHGKTHSITTTSEMGTLVINALLEITDRRFAYHAV
jgi:3-isopropylmalate dehydrogenase